MSEQFEKWNGDYEKRPYEVKVWPGDIVTCYPNAGRMIDLKTGRSYGPEDVEGIRPITWDEYWKNTEGITSPTDDKQLAAGKA
jgi:hypothetical protein